MLTLLLTFAADYALAGIVTVNDSHGNPIQDVTVQWSTNNFNTYGSGMTNTSGVVATAPTSGVYSFRALYHNTSAIQANKDIGASDVTFYTSEMQAQLYKHDGITPFQGILIKFSPSSGFAVYVSENTNAGGFAKTELFPGTIYVRATVSGTSADQNAVLAGDGTTGEQSSLLTFYTSESKAQVEDCSGSPKIENARIQFFNDGTHGTWVSVNTDANGVASTELFPGTHDMGASINNTSEIKTYLLAGDGTTSGQTTTTTFTPAKVNLIYSGAIHYWIGYWTPFTSPGYMFPATMKFRFGGGGGFESDIAISGCSVEERLVTIKLLDSHGNGLAGGEAQYNLGGWQTAGTTNSNGEAFALIDGLQNTLAFRMYWEDTYIDKNQNISSNSTVVFQTVLVKMELHSSVGAQLTGAGEVNSGGWKPLGDTPTAGKELLPKTYAFRIHYEDSYIDKNQNVASDNLVVFETVLVKMELHSSLGDQLTGAGEVNSGSWKPLGDTPTTGKELLPKTYAFRIHYEDSYIDKNQNVASDNLVVFETVVVKMELHSSLGAQLTGAGEVNSGSWKSLGNTPTAGMELLPKTYAFRIHYEDTYIDKNQNVASDQLVVFATLLVQMELHSSTGAQLTGEGQVNSGTWKSMGATPTATNDGGKELLPKTYAFRVYYEDSYIQKNQDVSSDHLVVFETELVAPPPSVTIDPEDQTVCDGCDATFNADADGDPSPTVQWQVSTDAGTNWDDINGATNTTLTFTSSASLNENQYRAVFTNTCGSCTTQVATLTVNSAKIYIYSALHTTGTGSKPPSKKTALPVVLEVFSKVGSMDPKDFGTTWNGSENLATDVAISDGGTVAYGGGEANLYTICVPAGGSYLVIGKASVDGQDVYIGSPTDVLAAGSTTKKYLQVIKNGAGKVIPATTTEVPGSLLLIAEPAYLEFTSDQELLPIVYESVDGVWDAMVQADPPEGFVSNPGALSTEVIDSTLKVVQFTIKDIGSSWTSTKVTHHLKHKGKDIKITSSMKMVNKRHKKGAGILAAGENDARTSVDLKFVPTEYALYQNYPDPFNPSTTLQFDLPEPAVVTMRVYNTLGQEVANLLDHVAYEPGKHAIKFDASRLSSGVYIYQLIAGRYVDTKKMLLLK
jgi:hypothetical protein